MTESINNKKTKTVIFASFTFLSGAMIYILFRPTNLLMFNLLDCIGLMGLTNSIRPNINDIPEWIIYSLPDGLWLFSYCLFIGCIWNFELKRCFCVLVILPIYAISHEIMQKVHFVSGTFDWIDLAAYLTAFVLGFIYIVCNKKESQNESLTIKVK